MQQRRIHLVLATLLCAFYATAQDAIVRSVRIVPDPDGSTVEIVTTRPLSPEITLVENPTRLVIDLSKAILPAAKVIPFHDDAITGLRVNQNQTNPAITRIVVDLTKPIGYSWDTAGNRLMIRLRPTPIATAPATSAAATSLVPASSAPGMAVTSKGGTSGGSAISAGTDVAVMRLPRGGEVHVCPGTTVSVTYSQSGRDLMLGMSTGSLETDYSLGADADSILTPDFRILMAGPGAFHYAISADSRGNTCVRSLPGNTAAVIVSELMGDKTYQVTPSGQAFFHSGRLLNASSSVPPDCGCPTSGVPVLKAADSPNTSTGDSQPTAPHVAVADPGIAELPPPQKNVPQVSVDAPFIFRASDPQAAQAPTKEVAGLAMTYALPPEPLEITVLPPPPPAPKSPGFFGKVTGFFSGIFGK
jgi:AMIN domain